MQERLLQTQKAALHRCAAGSAMGLTATLVGAFSGGTMVLFMRSFRKAPYFTSEPHATCQ